jgi:hypothetical protein
LRQKRFVAHHLIVTPLPLFSPEIDSILLYKITSNISLSIKALTVAEVESAAIKFLQ